MKKILVVDDSPTMRKMVIASLRNLNDVTVEEAKNGLEAIESISREPSIALMVLDLNMPEMHGLEVLKFVRKIPTLKKLPVIILTTRKDDRGCVEAYAAGADRYLVKPFEPQALCAQVKMLLKLGWS